MPVGPLGSVEAPKEDHTVLLICASVAVVVVLLTLCILCHRKRRRRRRGGGGGGVLHRPFQLPVPSGSTSRRTPQHVCEELGERFASVDSVWWWLMTPTVVAKVRHRYLCHCSRQQYKTTHYYNTNYRVECDFIVRCLYYSVFIVKWRTFSFFNCWLLKSFFAKWFGVVLFLDILF